MTGNLLIDTHKSLHILYSGLGGHASVFFALVKGDVKNLTSASAIFYGVEPMLGVYKKQCDAANLDWVEIKKRRLVDVTSGAKIYKFIEHQNPNAIVVHIPQALMPAVRWRDRNPETKILVVEHHPNNLKRPVDWLYGKRAMKHADQIIFLTPSYQQEVAEKYGAAFDESKSVIIPNGVDTDVYKPAPLNDSESDLGNIFRFGMCTRLSNQKDIATLIKAFSQLAKQYSDRTLELHIAGDGDIRTDLENLALKTKTPNSKVVFHGMLDEVALVSFFQKLQAYVHATHFETMSTSVMQALSSGLACVASDVPGMSSLVPKSVGSLTEVGNVADLVGKMEALLTNDNLRNERAESARQFALERLSCEKAAALYFDLMI